MHRIAITCALLFPLCAVAQTPASNTSSTPSTATATSSGAVEHLTLGESVEALNGPWKFHTGDDPAWSQPGFDDSKWAAMDLSAPADPSDPSQAGYLPGWTSQGYPGYAGFAWYRLQVDVSGVNRPIALRMPDSVDDAYQVFVNGTKIGEFGRFHGHHVVAYASLPRAFSLPKNVRNGRITIAIRTWMDAATPFNSPDAGGLHGPPMLGYASAIAGQVRLDFDDIAHGVGSGFLEMLILIMALLMAGTLFWLDPRERAYLWLALVCVATLVSISVVLLANFTTPMGQTSAVILSDVIATPMRIGLWVLFWAYWFRLPARKMKPVQIAVWVLVALLAAGTAMLRPPLYGPIVPVQAASLLLAAVLGLKLGLGLMLALVAYWGFTRNKAEGGMAVAAVVLAFVANFQHELRIVHITLATSIFGFAVSLGTLSTILSILIITVMLLRRFIHSQRRQVEWRQEIEQARSIQQVLIPDKLPVIEGMTIRSEYLPAREVGGDFFQILPLEAPDAALVIAGDVTGKGLQAGMLVALIVGAIRTAAQQTTEPERILRIVNEELFERGQASATCMILRISASGWVKIAHAGQLPPYLNGEEMELEGSLPLGMLARMEFPAEVFQLQPGDVLSILSDGVVEAQDSRGRLLGFERVREMMHGQPSATEIAAAAQKFGQADDITVLQMEWQGRDVAAGLTSEPLLAAH